MEVTGTESQKFSVLDLQHPRIEKYKPEFKGRGGQHLVYGLPDYPNKVAKVEAEILLRSLKKKLETGSSPSLEIVQPKLDQQNNRAKRLTDYFGTDHILQQSSHYFKVPINSRILAEINQHYGGEKLSEETIRNLEYNEILSIVTIQEKTQELSNPQRISLTAGYSELRPTITPDYESAYSRITNESIFNLESSNTINLKDFAKIHQHLAAIIEKAESNPNLKEVLKEFTEKTIRYIQDTGEILDLAGGDNVIFFENDQKQWQYLLPDALYPAPLDMVSEVRKVISTISKQDITSLTGREANILKNALNCVRVINGLANWLDVKERVDIVPIESKSLDPKVFLKAIY